MSEETNYDPFEEETTQPEAGDDGDAKVTPEDEGAEQQSDDEVIAEEENQEEEEGTGEENAETPSADPEGKGEVDPDDGKTIPMKQFKAALKQVATERDAANARLAEIEASNNPPPDRDKDPNGYDLHVRMETSKAIMVDAYPDYNEKIAHYQEMAKLNPLLNQAVASAAAPAKYAYDLAKKDMELREVQTALTSGEFAKFKEWQKQQANPQTPNAKNNAGGIGKQLVSGKSKVPNLNSKADRSNVQDKSSEDDDLFAGAL